MTFNAEEIAPRVHLQMVPQGWHHWIFQRIRTLPHQRQVRSEGDGSFLTCSFIELEDANQLTLSLMGTHYPIGESRRNRGRWVRTWLLPRLVRVGPPKRGDIITFHSTNTFTAQQGAHAPDDRCPRGRSLGVTRPGHQGPPAVCRFVLKESARDGVDVTDLAKKRDGQVHRSMASSQGPVG